MDIKISETAKAAAIKCKNGFACLKGNGFCAANDCVNGEVLFVKSQYNPSCPYQQRFANDFMCNCPVRLELFSKYGI